MEKKGNGKHLLESGLTTKTERKKFRNITHANDETQKVYKHKNSEIRVLNDDDDNGSDDKIYGNEMVKPIYLMAFLIPMARVVAAASARAVFCVFL